MSIYNEKKPSSNPFKTDDTKVAPAWQRPGRRQIRVVTTTRKYNLGSARGDPIVSTTYEYL